MEEESNELLLFIKTVDRDVRIHLQGDVIEEQIKPSNSGEEVKRVSENISLDINSIKTQDDAQNSANDAALKKSRTMKPEHICSECNKAFKRRDHLKEHFLIHTGERPHSCHICQKSFKRRSSLTAHFMTHQDVRPYVCPVCSKSFKTSSKLNVHRRSHAGSQRNEAGTVVDSVNLQNNEHKCNECGLKFTCSQDLNSHSKIHSNKSFSKSPQVESNSRTKSESSFLQSDKDAIAMFIDHCGDSMEDEISQKNSFLDMKLQDNEDVSNDEYEEWKKHFHMSGMESENEEDYAAEEKDFPLKEMEEGIPVNCSEDYLKTKNSGYVGYPSNKTKVLNFPDY